MRSNTVIWSLLFVMVPMAIVASGELYIAGAAVPALFSFGAAVVFALLFVISLVADFPGEKMLKEYIDQQGNDITPEDIKKNSEALEEALKDIGVDVGSLQEAFPQEALDDEGEDGEEDDEGEDGEEDDEE